MKTIYFVKDKEPLVMYGLAHKAPEVIGSYAHTDLLGAPNQWLFLSPEKRWNVIPEESVPAVYRAWLLIL